MWLKRLRGYKPKRRGCRSAKKIARKALREVNKLKEDKEILWKDYHFNASAMPNGTPVVSLLNGVAVGDDHETRNGMKIRMLTLSWKGNMGIQPGDIGQQVGCRVVVVYDRDTDQTALTWDDVITGTNDHQGLYDIYKNKGRFQIFYDRTFTFQTGCINSLAYKSSNAFKGFRKINRQTEFVDASATVASIAKGSLYIMVLPYGNSLTMGMTGWFRIRYTEG